MKKNLQNKLPTKTEKNTWKKTKKNQSISHHKTFPFWKLFFFWKNHKNSLQIFFKKNNWKFQIWNKNLLKIEKNQNQKQKIVFSPFAIFFQFFSLTTEHFVFDVFKMTEFAFSIFKKHNQNNSHYFFTISGNRPNIK